MDKSLQTGEQRTLKLDEIVPYWRNPRRITDEAVNALAESIKEFGYQQPIVVDAENVILIGHTRYAALRRLEYTEAPVLVVTHLNTQQAKELRVVDNRTGEYSIWDFEKLAEELGDLDSTLVSVLFPDAESGNWDTITPWQGLPDDDTEDADDRTVEFVCPKCFHEFDHEVTPMDMMQGVIRPSTTTTTEETA